MKGINMQKTDKKLVIFKSDCNGEDFKNKCFIKFLDSDNNYAIFYKPLIAPKNFKEYLRENKIIEAFIIDDDMLIEKYKNYIYTFESDRGVYKVSNEINVKKRLILLIDRGMEICLDLPKYLYEIINNKIYLLDFKEGKNKDYCYVIDSNEVNDILKNIMIETEEIVPGILNLSTYGIKSHTLTLNKK